METKNNLYLIGSVLMIIINFIWISVIYLWNIFIIDMYLIIPTFSIIFLAMVMILSYQYQVIPDKITIYEQLNKMNKNEIIAAIQKFEQYLTAGQNFKNNSFTNYYYILLLISGIPLIIITLIFDYEIKIRATFISIALFMISVVVMYKGILLHFERANKHFTHLLKHYHLYLEEISNLNNNK